jgi:hypothetical protein
MTTRPPGPWKQPLPVAECKFIYTFCAAKGKAFTQNFSNLSPMFVIHAGPVIFSPHPLVERVLFADGHAACRLAWI